MFRILFQILLFPLPWRIRRMILAYVYNYKIDPSARIGFSIISVESLEMGSETSIGHLNVIKNLSALSMGTGATIGVLNWISAFPKRDASAFAGIDRETSLRMGAHAVIVNRHLIDCTDTVYMDDFSSLAGVGTTVLTHAIDPMICKQTAAPVYIGKYTMVGAASILLKNSAIPSKCVVMAGSVITMKHRKEGCLYAGVPAREICPIGRYKFFERDHSKQV